MTTPEVPARELAKVESKLREWSRQLHDLSGRNRLLFYRETRSSSATILAPALRQVFKVVVERGKELTAPVPSAAEMSSLLEAPPERGSRGEAEQEIAGEADEEILAQDGVEIEAKPDPWEFDETVDDPAAGEQESTSRETEDEAALGQGDEFGSRRPAEASASAGHENPAASRKRNEIATNHSTAQLNRVLYNLHYTGRTVQEEQGIHILYLTLGMLRWKENQNTSFHEAPLILVPVQVERANPNAPYKIRMAEEDILVNPVLQIKLSKDFGIRLPDVANDISSEGLEEFLSKSAKIIARFRGWEIRERVTLGAFNFLTLLLIKDLDSHASLYRQHPIIQLLSGVEGAAIPLPENIPEASELDDLVDPANVFQVLDADSSQQEAIEAAKRGLSFVLQGPPGTGKSQTIANIIVESIMAGKRVLFVSQKSAALEVVRKRLAAKGLQEFCLEIHSHKLDKRRVLQDLMSSLSTSAIKIPNPDFRLQQAELKKIREELNTYVRQLHEPRFELGWSLYQARSRLAASISAPSLDFSLADVEHISATDYSRMVALVRELAAYPEIIEAYPESRWKGYAGGETSLARREELAAEFEAALEAIEEFHDRICKIVYACGLPMPETIQHDLDYYDTLRCYTPAIFSGAMQPAIERRLHETHRIGRYFDAQYREDAAALRSVSRPGVRASPEEFSRILAFVRKSAKALGRRGVDRADRLEAAGDVSSLSKRRDQIQRGFELASSLFGAEELPEPLRKRYDLTPAEAADWFAEHSAYVEELEELTDFNLVRAMCTEGGLRDFVVKALAARLPAEKWEGAFVHRFHRVLIEALMRDRPLLQRFKGVTQTELVRRFRTLDIAMVENSAREVRASLQKKKPHWSWLQAGSAETSVLRREASKKRRVMPLRKLFEQVPTLIQALKPCLMMSPLTVCQLLEPSIYQFDIVVFDEASQLPPEYAAGAFMRARQAVVAGDSQQLPPTNFFHNLEAEGAEYEPDTAESVFESILSACDSAGFPSKMLNWHYRSKDESLIAYSNYHFYGNRLDTFPNSMLNNPATGLKFVYVDRAVYKGGEGARFNLAEAQRVAELVYEHLMTTPQLSLGIVTLSVPQRRVVEAEIDRLRMEHAEVNELFAHKLAEPIFVKNLENVQGDERDAIILSIGYGKDADGRLALNFGPINQEGGARRLNVAVTRARYMLKLVASIQPEDIDLTRATSRGAFLLRNYLAAARDGVGAISEQTRGEPEAPFDFDFENLVFHELTEQGLHVEKQVGVSQYRIDLAIVDPEEPGRYLLGIECDGAMYHSASTARDRDRLRQQVLEGLGWRIHRIWSRDWIQNREREIAKILKAIERQRAGAANTEIASDGAAGRRGESRRDEDATETPSNLRQEPWGPASAQVYQRWKPQPKASTGKSAFLAAPLSEIIDDLQAIANAEGPVSVKIAKALVLQAWGARSGQPVDERLEMAIDHGAQQRAFRRNGNFLWPPGLHVAPLRIHAAGQAIRPIDQIAPEEIEAALRECIQEAVTITRADLLRETCKLFGLKATEDNLAAVGSCLDALLSREVVALQNEKVSRGEKFSAKL